MGPNVVGLGRGAPFRPVVLAVILSSCVMSCGREHVRPVSDAGPPLPGADCLDSDGDGFPGTGSCDTELHFDCDDRNPSVYPGAPELCNGIDDSCNGRVDEGLTVTGFYQDADQDGIGGQKVGEGCASPPSGAVTVSGDCDDANAAVRPGAAELCNGADDDCDGTIDNGLPFQDFYPDVDRDGFGAASGTPTASCAASVTGKVANRADCDDANGAVKPGRPRELQPRRRQLRRPHRQRPHVSRLLTRQRSRRVRRLHRPAGVVVRHGPREGGQRLRLR